MEKSSIIDINLKIIVPPRKVEDFENLAKSLGWKPENWLNSVTFVANHLIARLQGMKYSSADALKKYQWEIGIDQVNAFVAEYDQFVKISHRILIWWPTE